MSELSCANNDVGRLAAIEKIASILAALLSFTCLLPRMDLLVLRGSSVCGFASPIGESGSLGVDIRELLLERYQLRLVVDDDVALIGVLLQVVLMVILGGVECRQPGHLGHDRPRECLRRGQLLDVAVRNLLLALVTVENRRTVLGPVIGALAIQLRRIVRD